MDIRQTAIASLLLFAGCQALSQPPQESSAYVQPQVSVQPQRPMRPPQPPAPLPPEFQQSNSSECADNGPEMQWIDFSGNNGWIWPIQGKGKEFYISSGFGVRPFSVNPDGSISFSNGCVMEPSQENGEGVIRKWQPGDYEYKPQEHLAIDIAAPHGHPILAPRSGVVMQVINEASCGKGLAIDHQDGNISIFCHASELYAQQGWPVDQGDAIAAVGSTGQSSGPHLHYAIHHNNQPIDPMEVLP